MNDHEGQAALARHRILTFWEHNRAPLTGAYSIIDAYLALFGDIGPELDRWYGGWDFIPKTTSANAVYAAVEQTQAIQLDAAAVPPLPHTGVALVTYGPEKLGISLWNAVGRAMHNRRISARGPVIVAVSDGELQSNIDAAARLAGAARLSDLLVLLDANGLQSSHPITAVDQTLTPGPDGRRPIEKIWSGYGWWTAEADGHDRAAISTTIRHALAAEQPALVVLRTVKGRGLPQVEGKIGRYNHGVEPHLHATLSTELERRAARHPAPEPWPEQPALNLARQADRRPIDPVRITPSSTTRSSQVLAAWLEAFRQRNPDTTHVINSDTTYPFDPPIEPDSRSASDRTRPVGINEIGAFNIARGISQSGGFPIYLSPAVHLECCSDEFRLAGQHRDPMLVIGYNAGSHLSHWGPAYVSRRDLEVHRAPGVQILQPATTGDLAALLATQPSAGPIYLRLPHRLLDRPAQIQEATTTGLYRMTPDSSLEGELVLVATGAAVPIALATAQLLAPTTQRCAVVNLVRLTSIDPTALADELSHARHVCVLADGQTTSLELLLHTSLDRAQEASAMDLSQPHLNDSRWWLRKPIDHARHVADVLLTDQRER
jgi:transketolase